MTDYSELKRLARRVIDLEAADGGEPISEAWDEFEAAALPSVVLPMIAEIEQLNAERDDFMESQGRRMDILREEHRVEVEALRGALDTLAETREALIAQGRNFALDEASHLCFKTAFEKYYPAGTRYKIFTPKTSKAVGDALVEAANLIAELPDGPYQRYAERQAKLAAFKESQS